MSYTFTRTKIIFNFLIIYQDDLIACSKARLRSGAPWRHMDDQESVICGCCANTGAILGKWFFQHVGKRPQPRLRTFEIQRHVKAVEDREPSDSGTCKLPASRHLHRHIRKTDTPEFDRWEHRYAAELDTLGANSCRRRAGPPLEQI